MQKIKPLMMPALKPHDLSLTSDFSWVPASQMFCEDDNVLSLTPNFSWVPAHRTANKTVLTVSPRQTNKHPNIL
jgi:hypothetical protein